MTEEITFRSDFAISVVDEMANDESVLRAMLVATDKVPTGSAETTANTGRINALMRDRHGTPFEHNSIIFYAEAPIFVFREWHRHRIGISINEQSGRYSELPPMFYVPPRHRPLVKVEGTKQMAYENELASDEQYARKIAGDKRVMAAAYREYERQLEDGIVKESARNCLPVSIYSKMFWTCNARSLMAFLSLRVRKGPFWNQTETLDGVPTDYWTQDPEGSVFPSKPAWEIDACAQAMEQLFATLMPVTHEAFLKHGRVAP
jgi:thymidylate synthase (FAD)